MRRKRRTQTTPGDTTGGDDTDIQAILEPSLEMELENHICGRFNKLMQQAYGPVAPMKVMPSNIGPTLVCPKVRTGLSILKSVYNIYI